MKNKYKIILLIIFYIFISLTIPFLSEKNEKINQGVKIIKLKSKNNNQYIINDIPKNHNTIELKTPLEFYKEHLNYIEAKNLNYYDNYDNPIKCFYGKNNLQKKDLNKFLIPNKKTILSYLEISKNENISSFVFYDQGDFGQCSVRFIKIKNNKIIFESDYENLFKCENAEEFKKYRQKHKNLKKINNVDKNGPWIILLGQSQKIENIKCNLKLFKINALSIYGPNNINYYQIALGPYKYKSDAELALNEYIEYTGNSINRHNPEIKKLEQKCYKPIPTNEDRIYNCTKK